MRNALVNIATGFVETVIILTDITQWPIPSGRQLVPTDTGNVGDTWNGSIFIPSPQPAPAQLKLSPTPRQWLERLSPATQAALTAAAVKDTTGGMLLWLLRAAGNPSIDVTSAETQQGVQAMVTAGVITAQDQQTLLAP